MFGFLLRKEPEDPPTDKQIRYASRLGIEVTPSMSKSDVTEAITEAERNNPELTRKREKAKVRIREDKFGKDAVKEEARWNRFADDNGYMLAVYRKGEEIIVDVLLVNEAHLNERGKLRLGVAAPKVVEDKYIGQHLEWERHFEMPIESLLHFEDVDPEFYSHDAEGFEPGNTAYRKIVEKGLRIAKKL